MNTNQGALYFGAGVDMKEWRKNIEEMRKDILGINEIVKKPLSKPNIPKPDNPFEEIESSLKRLQIGIAGYFTFGFLKDFTNQLINIRGEFQRTELAFETMLKSKSKADALMGELVDLAEKTPFGFQDVTEGAKRLLAFQVPAEEVTETLRRMGDVAAGLGVPMGQLIHVYGQVKAQGKMMTNDLYQFMNAGIPILSELSKVLGKTEAEIKDMVGAGQIGFNEVQQVIKGMTDEGGLFFNLMETQSASLTGKMERLGDAFQQMMNDIGRSSQDYLAGGIDAVASLIENYDKVLQVLVPLISSVGTYKAALITTSVVQKIVNTYGVQDAVTKQLQIGATLKQIAVQTTLNKVMMANPYAIAIAGAIGLVSAVLSLDTQLESVTDRLERYEKSEKEAKDTGEGLINVIKSENTTLLEKAEAVKKLQELAPETFANMSREEISAMDLTEAHKKLNEELGKKREIKEIEDLQNLKKEYESLLNLKNLNVDDADGKISKRIDILREEINVLELKEKTKKEALMSENETLEKQLEYWKKEEKAINDVIETLKKTNPQLDTIKLKAGEIPKEFEKTGVSVGGITYKLNDLVNRLRQVQNEARATSDKINNIGKDNNAEATPNTYNYWSGQLKKWEDAKKGAEYNSKEYLEALKEIAKAQKELEKFNPKEPKRIAPKEKSQKVKIDYIKGSEAELMKQISDINDKIQKKTLLSDTKTRNKLISQREALERKLAEIRGRNIKQSFDEEISELERQWKVRYILAEKYGEEIAKAQFSNLKGESYFDEIKSRFDKLDNKVNNGAKLSDEEINQWEKLKQILDNLTGEKDPFTNWKDGLEDNLKGINSYAEKISYIEKEIENLTPEQKSSGYLAELNNQLDNLHKGYKDFYDNFINEHKTYEEKQLEITKKYADLRAKARGEAELKKIKDLERVELGKLAMEDFVNSDEWKIAMDELEYYSKEAINRILGDFKRFKKENEQNLSSEDIDKLNNAIRKLEGASSNNPLNSLIRGTRDYIQSKRELKQAQEEYNRALREGTEEEIRNARARLNKSEQKTAEKGAGLKKTIGDLQGGLGDFHSGITSIADAFGGMSDSASDALNDIMGIADTGMQMAQNILNRNVIGAVASGVKMLGQIFNAFSGDKKKERAIKREQQALERLKTAYEELAHAANKAFNARDYGDQTKLIQNLRQQQQSLNYMIASEMSKKKTDYNKIAQWQGQIVSIDRTIEDLKENVIKDVLQTDLASAASKVGDALVEAFSRGEDSAKSLEKVSNDMIKNLLKNQLNLMLQKRMEGTLKDLFKATGLNENGTGVFRGLTKEEIARFKGEVQNAGEQMRSFLEGYREIFDNIDDGSDSLKGAIKGMSEETAGVLVGQFYAIRINTGEIIKMQNDSLEVIKNTAMTLVNIEHNTANLFQIRKDISELNSKIKSDGSIRAMGL